MGSIYKQIVELTGNYTVPVTEVARTYHCKDATTPADYTVTLPASGVTTGTVICIEGDASLTKLVTITSTAKIDNRDKIVIGAGGNLLLKWSGSTWASVAGDLKEGLHQDMTVTIPAGSSLETIQAIVDAQPRNLNGYTLTFQFADGTYELGDDALVFKGFYGKELIVIGNPSESYTTVHTNQAVILKSARSTDGGVIEFHNCACMVNVRNLKCESTTAIWQHCIIGVRCLVMLVQGCYLRNSQSSAYGSGVWIVDCFGRVDHCQVESVDKCVGSDGGGMIFRDSAGSGNNFVAGAWGGIIQLNNSIPSYNNALAGNGFGGQVWKS
jgi:hypothetical protein